MIDKIHLKTTEVLKLCRICSKNPLNSGNPQSCTKIGDGFCERARKADSALADFKYWIIDESSKKTHEELKKRFATQKAEEDKKTAPIEEAHKKDLERVVNVEKQIIQKHSDFEDFESPIFGFQPVR